MQTFVGNSKIQTQTVERQDLKMVELMLEKLNLQNEIRQLKAENQLLRKDFLFEDGEKIEYVSSQVGDCFHHRDCKWMHGISKRNLTIWSSRREALASGLKNCKSCRS